IEPPVTNGWAEGVVLPFARGDHVHMCVEHNGGRLPRSFDHAFEIDRVAVPVSRKWKGIPRVIHDAVVHRYRRRPVRDGRHGRTEVVHTFSFLAACGGNGDEFFEYVLNL